VGGEKASLLPRALEARPQGGRQGGAIPWLHLVKLGVDIALQGELHAMAGSQAFEAIDDTGAVLFRRRQFPVELPAVFLLHARDAAHTPHLLLTGAVAPAHRQELADIEPIGLGPALAPIDLNTGGIDAVVLDAMHDPGAVQPEAVAASLGAAHDARVLRQAKALLRSCDLLL